jgi:mycothiol synthase
MTSAPRAPEGFQAVVGGAIDTAELVDHIVRVQMAIDGTAPATESFVRMMLGAPGVDAPTDVITLRHEGSGDLAGFGVYYNPASRVESVTMGWVDPDCRNRALGSTIVAWGLDRARSQVRLAPPGARVTNRCQASDADVPAARLFADFGYTPDRREVEMRLDFTGPVEMEEPPDGVTVRTMSGAEDIPIVAAITTEAFKDHYGWVESSRDETIDRWRNYRAMDEWDDDLVFIAESPDGPAGALVGTRSFGSNLDVGYIGSLGVLRPWRGKGLGRSLLTTAFGRYQQRGKRAVVLDVDADNLTGATRLYESVGMKPVRAETSYLIELRYGHDMVKR